jgi:trehalose 6-phosphate synthase/phosphatase
MVRGRAGLVRKRNMGAMSKRREAAAPAEGRSMETKRLVVVSNRLPVVLKKSNGTWNVTPGAGGLVTAMGPVLRDRGGLWIGWLGTPSEQIGGEEQSIMGMLERGGSSKTGYSLKPVSLTQDDLELYYKGFSNEILWPLFHDIPSNCNFAPAYWDAYRRVNKKFAQAIVEYTDEDDYVWIHDYHLILVAAELKKLGIVRQLGFYLHIPFPSLDIFLKLPWRFKILEALMEYNLIGFQTMRDRRNFIQCVRAMTKGGMLKGRGHVSSLVTGDREMRVGAFPISIDYEGFSRLAASREVSDLSWAIRSNMENVKIVLGVDRLDYTKGVPQRLLAMADAMQRYPDLQGRIVLVQILVPSRRSVEKYESLKQEIERLVGEINGRFTKNGWNPIQYFFRALKRPNLVAYYRTSDIALVTPIKDGMNLVAKEYCACNIEENGVLILSEFAGAAGQLQKGALLVNPHDITGMADAIHQAFLMESDERQKRMRRLRRSIQKSDIFQWVNSFLRAGIEKDLNHFPRLELFIPGPSEKDLEEEEEFL